jgi:putative Holliday junction resolvase
MSSEMGTIAALDVGEVRIGVATAHSIARIATPLTTLHNDDTILRQLQELCRKERITRIVVGLPRGLNGQSTAQTARVEAFAKRLEQSLVVPISWQDEALTSVQATSELEHRGRSYSKGDIDALAATYILEDYLRENV